MDEFRPKRRRRIVGTTGAPENSESHVSPESAALLAKLRDLPPAEPEPAAQYQEQPPAAPEPVPEPEPVRAQPEPEPAREPEMADAEPVDGPKPSMMPAPSKRAKRRTLDEAMALMPGDVAQRSMSILGLSLAALETATVKMAMGLQPLKDGKGKPVIDDYGRPVTELDAEGAAKISSAIARNVGTLTQIHGLFEPRALASGGMSISDDPEIRAAQRQKLLAIFDETDEGRPR